MSDQITEQAFRRWKNDRVTKKLMFLLLQSLDEIDATIVEDGFLLHENVAIKGAQLSGFKSAILNVTEITLPELNSGEDDDEGEEL